MTVIIDGGAGVTFPDTVQQTNAVTNTGGAPRYYAARAWVNFNGSSTPVIRASANVSSITDNGTGDFTVNFATSMPDANFVFCGGYKFLDGSGNSNSDGNIAPYNFTSNSVSMIVLNGAGGFVDSEITCVSIFR